MRRERVDPARAGQRIDNYLLGRLKGVPRSRVYRLLRRGEVRVNGRRAAPSYRLQAGDELRLPPVRTAEGGPVPPPAPRLLERLAAAVLYEDREVLVVNKPAGVPVHGGSGLAHGVIDALRLLRPGEALELAHRLDRDTSGCLVVARRRSALRALHRALREGEVDKTYLALVRGGWGRAEEVRAPLLKNVLRSGERVVRVDRAGKEARTLFRPLRRYPLGPWGATLVEARPLTGRTHQIRVHARHAGHPIAGDPRYGDPAFDRALAPLGLRRLFLHAARVAFTLPSGRRVAVEAPLEGRLQAVLQALHGKREGERGDGEDGA
ncbi:MAG: RluA family pseudouridine synthase [Gammaproteobacteria bacterium]|nr:MAG: RluA family pseudouridine synthase [Gammaproteobacteria bacterium]